MLLAPRDIDHSSTILLPASAGDRPFDRTRRRRLSRRPGPSVLRDSRALRERHSRSKGSLLRMTFCSEGHRWPPGARVALPLPLERDTVHQIASEMRREDDVHELGRRASRIPRLALEDIEGGARETPGARSPASAASSTTGPLLSHLRMVPSLTFKGRQGTDLGSTSGPAPDSRQKQCVGAVRHRPPIRTRHHRTQLTTSGAGRASQSPRSLDGPPGRRLRRCSRSRGHTWSGQCGCDPQERHTSHCRINALAFCSPLWHAACPWGIFRVTGVPAHELERLPRAGADSGREPVPGL
jgi:hypothetical protein